VGRTLVRKKRDDEDKYKLSLLREFLAKRDWAALSTRRKIRFRGVNLSQWIAGRRVSYRNGTISDSLIPLFEAIPGWSWYPVRDRQRKVIDNLRSFARRNGWDALRHDTMIEGIVLADWCKARRAECRRKVLPRWIARALAAIPGWSWEPFEDAHRTWLRTLRDHVGRHGWHELRLHTLASNGSKIGQWVTSVRLKHRSGQLPAWVSAELEKIRGWTWEPLHDRRARKLKLLRRFVDAKGWERLTRSSVIDGFEVGKWVVYCRDRYRTGALSKALARGFEAIPGWSWRIVVRR